MRLSAEKETSRRHILGSKIFKEQLLEIFGKKIIFQKKYLVKSRTMPKNLKRGHLGLFNVFYKPKTSKKCKGVPFDKIRKFSKKVAQCRKNPKGGHPLVSPVLLEALKNLWFSARIEPTLSGLFEDEQI